MVLAAVALVALVFVWRGRQPAARDAGALVLPPIPVPAAGVSEGATAVGFDDFTGSDACAGCHATEYEAWVTSTHGRAGGPPSSDLLLRAFDGRPIRFSDATVTPMRDGRGRHAFTVAWDGRPEQVLPVDGVVGGGHMLGGGTQGFVSRMEDGTVRLLPFELSRREGVWFCNTNTRLDSGWLPITGSRRLADCGDWPPVRALGTHARLASCQECHGSQIEVAPEPGRPAATRYTSLTINCESCHGPGRAHIEITRAPDAATRTDIGMRALATLSKDASINVCFACHALKDALAPGFLSGRPLDTFYSLLLPLLDADAPILPDGRIRTFAYQQGHLWSDCYLSGSMTCTDCHDPHSQRYRDVNGRPLRDPFDDGQCTACHQSKASAVVAHTKHAAASPGSRCVACHMPYLQEPEVGTALRYARSDHVIPVPRPAFDAALGIKVACASCHDDRDAAALEAQATEWWGELKPHTPLVRALTSLDGARGTGSVGSSPTGAGRAGVPIDDLLSALDSATTAGHRAAAFMALGVLVRDHLQPDMSSLDQAWRQRLRVAAQSTDPDIAALGLAGLHYADVTRRDTRQFLIERAGALGDAAGAVRSRWAVVLGFLADRHMQRDEVDAAIVTYRRSLEAEPARAATSLSLGIALARQGDAAAAEAAYRTSVRADSTNTLAHVNLASLLAARGDLAGAVAVYREALRIDPFDALAHFNLGNLFLRAGQHADAAAQYEQAIRFAPGLPDAHFNLARAHIALGRLEGARDALRDGLEFRRDTVAAQALREIEAQLGAR